MTDIYEPPKAGLEKLDNDDDAAKRAFVGSNYDYYQRKWAAADRTGSPISFNVIAFLFTLPWMIYRKMYAYSGILCAAAILTTLPDIALELPEAFSRTISLAIGIVAGLFGNYWYRLHIEKKIRQITSSLPPAQAQVELIRTGGTNLAGALLVTALLIGLTVMAAMGID